MRCENCGFYINNPRKWQRYCNSACRAAAWRDKAILRCPNCKIPLRFRAEEDVLKPDVQRSNGK